MVNTPDIQPIPPKAVHDIQPIPPTATTIELDNLPPYQSYQASIGGGSGYGAPAISTVYTGDKFPTGFGVTELFHADHWTLRARSEQLFTENLYAEGLINRLITNEINIGLFPEIVPDSNLLPMSEDELQDWGDIAESRFAVWANNPRLCDFKGENTFGALQRIIKAKALVSGDVLVTLQQSPRTKLPMINLIDGSRVQSPFIDGELTSLVPAGHKVRHGVETDKKGRVVAYWVQNNFVDDGNFDFRRIVATSKRTGRRNAWLVFGTEKRVDDVRGMPILGILLQSLKEIDRYRDSVQRKAVVNSLLAMFIKKTEDKFSTNPFSNSAVRNDTVTVDTPTSSKQVNVSSNLPGIVAQELQHGEEPVLLGGQGTDVNFSTFETAIIQAVAWAKEIPPEILTLSFSSNYSASQAAINEFKAYLRKSWSITGDTVLTPIYTEWLLSEVLIDKISAPGFLESWRDPLQYDIYGAWITVHWYGTVKPSTDLVKQGKGSQIMVREGWSTNARESREINGSKFNKNIQQLRRENQAKADAARPLAEFEQEFGRAPDDVLSPAASQADDILDTIDERVTQLVEEGFENVVSN